MQRSFFAGKILRQIKYYGLLMVRIGIKWYVQGERQEARGKKYKA
jgi:hypothetical protein